MCLPLLCAAGDPELLTAVQRLHSPPMLWVVGHIHEDHGIHQLLHKATGKRITVVNAATARLARGNDGARPWVVHLPSMKMEQPTMEPAEALGAGKSQAAQTWQPQTHTFF